MMRVRVLLGALLLSAAAGAATGPSPGLGQWSASVGAGEAPLTLPLAQSTTPIFTFLGSFKSPFSGAAGAMSVSGSKLYVSAKLVDPYNTSNYDDGEALGALQIPTLTGIPAYDGSNGGTATVVVSPTAPATVVAPADYTLTAAPATGATSATLTSLPPGFAANDGWYVQFHGTDSPIVYVRGLTGNTFSWTGGLSGSGYSTTATIHQWWPSRIFSNDQSITDRVTGSMVYGGTLYITGGTYYDSNCNKQSGWIVSANTDITGWGTPNTVAGQVAQYSRYYSGLLSPTPSLWQSVLGGPAFVGSALGLSIASCYVPQGFAFNVFDPSTVASGAGAVTVTQELNYPYHGTPSSPGNPTQLSFRQFTGPFPSSGPYNGTYTLASAPTNGATAVMLASPFPNNDVTGFYDTTSTATTGTNSTTLVAAAPTGSWPSTWAANYWVGGFINDLTRGSAYCRIGSSTAVSSGSSGTMTVTCKTSSVSGMVSGDHYVLSLFQETVSAPYKITFSDGETRLVELTYGSTAVPDTTAGATFSLLTGCTTGTCTVAPLSGCPCTASVTIAPLGDQFFSAYDGPLGTEFIEPGSRSLLVISKHQYGPSSGVPTSAECNSGSSGSNDLPLSPDTTAYNSVQVSAYDLVAISNQKNGSPNPVYTATPYAHWDFPGWQNMARALDGCLTINGTSGWMTYDSVGGILYGIWQNSGVYIVGEWSVSSM